MKVARPPSLPGYLSPSLKRGFHPSNCRAACIKSAIAKYLYVIREKFNRIFVANREMWNTKKLKVNKVFFINLDERPDRLSHMLEQLQACPWPYERVQAIRIKTNPEAVGLRLVPQLRDKPHVISIWLSHRKALERALSADGEGPFVVLEDDVKIEPALFRKRLRVHSGVPNDWEIIMLSTRFRKELPPDETGLRPIAPFTKKPFGYDPILLRDALGQFICTGAHFCIFRDKATIRRIIGKMDSTIEKYDVDHFYVCEAISYGIHSDLVTVAPLSSDHL